MRNQVPSLRRSRRPGLARTSAFSGGAFSPIQLPGLLAWYRADSYTDVLGASLASASSQSLSAAGQTWTDGLTKLSFCCTFRLTTLVANLGICGKWAYQTQGQFAIQTHDVGAGVIKLKMWVASAIDEDGSNFAVGSTALALGELYKLVVVYDGSLAAGSRLQFYLNGAAETMSVAGGGTLPASMTTSTAALTIGQAFTGSLTRYFNGTLARFGWWPTIALTSGDASLLHRTYQGTSHAQLGGTALSAQPTRWHELSEASGNRADLIGAATMVPANTPGNATVAINWTDLSGNGFTGTWRHTLPTVSTIGSSVAFLIPQGVSPSKCYCDIGLPAGASKPNNWAVYAVGQSPDVTQNFQWLHASYPSGAVDDKNSWGTLLARDTYGTNGSVCATYGNDTNYSLGESATGLITNGTPFRFNSSYTAGNTLATARLDGAAISMTETEGPGVNHPATACSGTAYASWIGNVDQDAYISAAAHRIGEIILYGGGVTTVHSAIQAQKVEAYQKRFFGL